MADSLPAKEAAQFKHVVHLYEMKQLKKSIKTADTILRKFPGHGETLAMKGLAYSALGRKEEAYALVRRGLAASMSSHVCWHVFGLLYRSDREYHAAAKAYLNALRLDRGNAQILRDLALLQVHIRDFPGLLETRHMLLMSKPGLKVNWAGLAVANHLGGDTQTAVRVVDSYTSSFKENDSADPDSDYQASEVALYKAMLLEEGGDLEAAVAHLDAVRGVVVDSVQWRERRARVLHRLGRFVAAEADLRHLLDLNPDNRAYHAALHAAVAAQQADLSGGRTADQVAGDDSVRPPLHSSPLECAPGSVASVVAAGVVVRTSPASDDSPDVRRVVRLSDALARRNGRSLLCRRLPLEVLDGSGPDFFARLDAYVRPMVVKGVPSTFSDIKPLYADPAKVSAIARLFAHYTDALESTGELPPPVGGDSTVPQPEGPLRAPAVDGVATESASAGDTPGPPASVTPVSDVSAGVDDLSIGDGASANGTHIDGGGGSGAKGATTTPGEPGVKLWVRHFVAQHLDAVGDHEAAIACCEATIAAWPSLVEPRLVLARVLKHAGNLGGATDVANAARQLDLSDRYVNTKSVKAALRAGRLDDAAAWISLFTRDGDSGGAQALYDMQVSWYENSMADGLLAAGDLPRAFKHYRAVLTHFDDIEEDQFDFHTYCLRKMTLVSYVSLLRMEDTVRSHTQFSHGSRGAIGCLLTLADMPAEQRKAGGSASLMPSGSGELTASQRKKALSKLKKRVAKGKSAAAATNGPAKADTAASTAAAVTAAADHGKGGGAKKEDDKDEGAKKKAAHGSAKGWMDTDPSGEEHIKELADPVAACVPLVAALEKACPADVRTHTAAVAVALRRHLPLLALRGLLRARSIDATHPEVVRATLLLRQAVVGQEGGPDGTPPADAGTYVCGGGDSVVLPSGSGGAPTVVKVHPDVASVLRAEVAAAKLWPDGGVTAYATAVLEAVATGGGNGNGNGGGAAASSPSAAWLRASTLVTVAEVAGVDAVGGVDAYAAALEAAVAEGAGDPRPLASIAKRVKAQRALPAAVASRVAKACQARFPRSDLFSAA